MLIDYFNGKRYQIGENNICHPDSSNQTPIAVNDTVTIGPTASSNIDVLANDRDPDGDRFYISTYTQPTHGRVTINYTLFTRPIFIYTPNSGTNNTTDSFNYTISDSKRRGTATATVTINIAPIPNTLSAGNDNIYTKYGKTTEFNILSNDLNPINASILNIRSNTHPARSAGTLTLTKTGTNAGKAVFTPRRGFSGAATFTYIVANEIGQTSTATVNINVAPNTRPYATGLPINNYEVRINTPKQLITNTAGVSWGGDAEDGRITVPYRITQPANGRITQRNGQYFYTPRRGFVGNDSFSYTVRDSAGAVSEPAVVRFYVTATPSS